MARSRRCHALSRPWLSMSRCDRPPAPRQRNIRRQARRTRSGAASATAGAEAHGRPCAYVLRAQLYVVPSLDFKAGAGQRRRSCVAAPRGKLAEFSVSSPRVARTSGVPALPPPWRCANAPPPPAGRRPCALGGARSPPTLAACAPCSPHAMSGPVGAARRGGVRGGASRASTDGQRAGLRRLRRRRCAVARPRAWSWCFRCGFANEAPRWHGRGRTRADRVLS